MKKRVTAWLLVMIMAIAFYQPVAKSAPKERLGDLRVGNTTPLSGCFFTTMWGGTTSDLDIQMMLHGYAPVSYDTEEGRYRTDSNVVQDMLVTDDAEGRRTYLVVLYDDLKYSDGTRITARDYAFSILFTMDRAIAETGGQPADYSWIEGAEEYLTGKSKTLAGLRVISDYIFSITARADSLPYFYEMSRLDIWPYPAEVLAPGTTVIDEGEGAALSAKLNAKTIRETVLDPVKGYLCYPDVVSGPYTLVSFDGGTVMMRINPYYKGNRRHIRPEIQEVVYTRADNKDMIDKLEAGYFDLLNKVTLSDDIRTGLERLSGELELFNMDNYARTGLTILWFMEGSVAVQEAAVRRAIAYCFDRDGFTEEYAGPYGIKAEVFSGVGQWMYKLASGMISAPVDENLPEAERKAAEEEYAGLTLDGLTRYELNTGEAARLLEEAGWKLNNKGVREKNVKGKRVDLTLTLAIPENGKTAAAIRKHLIGYLQEIGIDVILEQKSMEEIERIYRTGEGDADLLYLGENFSITVEPGILAPTGKKAKNAGAEESLTAAKEEVYTLAKETVRTEPTDIAGFERKWIATQERLTETLPLLPVYTNVYFDFYTRRLHGYRISEMVSAGEAIVESYMSDIEEISEEEKKKLEEAIGELIKIKD